VPIKKRTAVLQLYSYHLVTLPGRNKRRWHESFAPEEAEEPVMESITLAQGVAGLQPFS